MNHEDIQGRLRRASYLLNTGKAREVIACIDEIAQNLVETDDRIEAAALRAWALSELGQADDALASLRRLMREFPEAPRLHGTLGVVLSNVNRLEEARESLELAVTLDESDPILLANLGYVYEKLGECGIALAHYDEALENGADLGWILQRKGAAQRECEDYLGAKSTLRRYLSLAPDDDQEWTSLAIVYSELGDYESAFKCYQQAEQLSPDSPSLRFNWGLTAERAGRIDLARVQLEHLNRSAGHTPQPYLLKAFILEHEGRLREAYSAHMDALGRVPVADRDEMAYTVNAAIEFCIDHRMTREAKRLFQHAYRHDACTVDVCESYREALNDRLDDGYWFSIMVETDLSPAFVQDDAPRPGRRHLRNYQIIAQDRDDAVDQLGRLLKRMGETTARIVEFVDEEPIDDDFAGVYEVASLPRG
jgi:Flp pilus assembly protein TadD